MSMKILFPLCIALVVIGGGYVFLMKENQNGIIVADNDLVPGKMVRTLSIPASLERNFSTDWSRADPVIEKALSGGPGKDGIPAIDDPKFISVAEFKRSDTIQAVVLIGSENVKVYPYNILTWHEIVNDTLEGQAVSVTFCPLCGSAIVYDRTLLDGETTFGVSGMLIESNMVMYDRESETLWQQSTGKAIAGEYYPSELTRVKFQLMTMGAVREKYPNAQVLSEETGYERNYGDNPYVGYDENESFIFNPSVQDMRYPSKEIFVVFAMGEQSVAFPWLSLENGRVYNTAVGKENVVLRKTDGDLSIVGGFGEEIPFYFEMWFSWAVQHRDNGVVLDL